MVRIPVEYQEVEYLESSGTQWINTGIPLNTIADERTNWNLRFSPTSLSKVQILCGANKSEKQVVLLTSGAIRKDWAIPGRTDFSKILLVGGIYLISQTDGLFKLQSTEEDAETEQITRTTSSNYPFALFAKTTNSDGTTVENSTIAFMKLYSFNAFNGDSDICNFVPCYRKSDNEPGMYDTVSGTFFTNAGTGTFLVGNDVSWDTASLIERRRQILLNTPHLETISDSIASFKTDLAAPVKDCKVYFTPVQEGSGDPSPDNVRTITGWDGVTVYKTGKNLLDPSKLKNQAGWNIIQIKVIPNTLYTCSSSKSAADGTSGLFIYFTNVNGGGGPTANNVSASSPVTVRSTSTGYVYLSQRIVSGDKTFSDVWIQVEVGAEATAYEPYVANDEIPVSWETEAGTVFGGYVDLVRGEVVETWQKIILDGDETPNSGTNYNGNLGTNRYFSIPSTGLGYSVGSGYCDTAKFQRGSIWAAPDSHIGEFNINTAQLHVVFDNELLGISSDTSSADRTTIIKNWLTEHQMTFVVPLKTPITHQLTPETIKTLRGINNIWSNANGNIEVKFWKY